jgi:thiol-disulfide isomerase/thioredoxin
MAKKTYKRELIEWTILVVVGLTLYLTGWHTEVIGQLQRVVLATGVMKPDTEENPDKNASYDFRLVNMGGRMVEFSEFQGQTVFLNFWATWCPPCIAEMPDIQDLYEKKGNDVAFVMISLDEDPDKARRFIERKGFDFPVYFPSSRLPSVYPHRTIPTTYVISPEGKIALSQSGMAKYDTEGFRKFLDGLMN